MKEELPYKKDTTKKDPVRKARRSLIAGVAVAAFTIFSLVFLGMKIEQSRQETPLPANQYCLQALDLASKALQGEPVGLSDAIKKCRDNQSEYQVTIGGQK